MCPRALNFPFCHLAYKRVSVWSENVVHPARGIMEGHVAKASIVVRLGVMPMSEYVVLDVRQVGKSDRRCDVGHVKLVTLERNDLLAAESPTFAVQSAPAFQDGFLSQFLASDGDRPAVSC